MRAAGRLVFLYFGVDLLAGFDERGTVLRAGFDVPVAPFAFFTERVAAFFTVVPPDARLPLGAAATGVVLRRDFCGDFWIRVKRISSPT